MKYILSQVNKLMKNINKYYNSIHTYTHATFVLFIL